MTNKTGRIKIGTSGIVLPGAKQTFPEEFQAGSRLHYYSALFNTLEVNSTFYKTPKAATFEKWAAEVPEHFRFSVKLGRSVTHVKKLEFDQKDLTDFMHAADHLGQKKGCLLVQFPASISFDYFPEVEQILLQLGKLNTNGGWQLCVEMRHTSWYVPSFFNMLAKYRAIPVMHDMPGSKMPVKDFPDNRVYLRFHGPQGDYRGSYSDDFLRSYAERIREWLNEDKTVYVYFNNTIGNAFQNAVLLQSLLADKQ